MQLSYLRPSSVVTTSSGSVVELQPELASLVSQRTRVSVDTGVKETLLFRDVMLFLHDVVKMDMDRMTPTEMQRALDPVITAHPDQMFFEAFSADESAYARASFDADVFTDPDWETGTTNVEFSETLRGHIETMRTDRSLQLQVDPKGLDVFSSKGRVYQKKIRVPASWFRGFLEVQSAMMSPSIRLTLARMDVLRILEFLKQRKAQSGPRGMEWNLVPGKPVSVMFQPWNATLDLNSLYLGEEPAKVMSWGHRRLLKLQPILQKAESVEVFLLGSGLPSFYRLAMGADAGEVLFALTGWTDADWSTTSQRALFRPRADVGDEELHEARDVLASLVRATPEDLVARLGWPRAKVDHMASVLARNGELVVDLATGELRYRSLRNVPDDLKGDIRISREVEAGKLLAEGAVDVRVRSETPEGLVLRARVRGTRGTYESEARISREGEFLTGSCDCEWVRRHGLRMGPCKHLLALKFLASSVGA